jgi:hypothetical protein
MMSWRNVCQRTIRRGIPTYVYANNPYAGFAAATVEQFQKSWRRLTKRDESLDAVSLNISISDEWFNTTRGETTCVRSSGGRFETG